MEETSTLLLGCPVWACTHWKGALYTAKVRREDYLPQYSSVFNTVEVNSTFYALPPVETVSRWASETHDGFQFCLKFPRAVTHEKQLRDCGAEMLSFLRLLDLLKNADRLGPSFLQLPPFFDGKSLPVLKQFLQHMPGEFPVSVEVRHPDWFDGGACESGLNSVLSELGMDRCLFDSRGLFSKPASDPAEEESQRRKPRSPFRTTVTGTRPMARIIGRNQLNECRQVLVEWAEIVAGWIGAGLSPIVFTHAPDDRYAPEMGRAFYRLLRELRPSLPEMNPWPGEAEGRKPVQKSLF